MHVFKIALSRVDYPNYILSPKDTCLLFRDVPISTAEAAPGIWLAVFPLVLAVLSGAAMAFASNP